MSSNATHKQYSAVQIYSLTSQSLVCLMTDTLDLDKVHFGHDTYASDLA